MQSEEEPIEESGKESIEEPIEESGKESIEEITKQLAMLKKANIAKRKEIKKAKTMNLLMESLKEQKKLFAQMEKKLAKYKKGEHVDDSDDDSDEDSDDDSDEDSDKNQSSGLKGAWKKHSKTHSVNPSLVAEMPSTLTLQPSRSEEWTLARSGARAPARSGARAPACSGAPDDWREHWIERCRLIQEQLLRKKHTNFIEELAANTINIRVKTVESIALNVANTVKRLNPGEEWGKLRPLNDTNPKCRETILISSTDVQELILSYCKACGIETVTRVGLYEGHWWVWVMVTE